MEFSKMHSMQALTITKRVSLLLILVWWYGVIELLYSADELHHTKIMLLRPKKLYFTFPLDGQNVHCAMIVVLIQRRMTTRNVRLLYHERIFVSHQCFCFYQAAAWSKRQYSKTF